MQRLYHPPNPTVMDAIQKKELLHLRIEQANEQMLDALAAMAETLFRTWQPEVVEEREWTDEEIMATPPPPSMRKRMTVDESNADLREAIAECERGDFLTAEEMEKDMATW